jgi:hypothetical protein
MTSNPFQAAITLWQNYTNAWFRVWNEFFKYPTAITGEIGFSVLAYLCKEKSAQDHRFRAMGELAFQSIVHTS